MAKDNSKQAKFFCESCGKEVKQNAKVCTYCGKFFSSVRCPKCGKTGSTSEFENGCPSCGYAVPKGNISYSKNVNSKENFGNAKNHFYFHKKNNNTRKNTSSDSLPLWTYILCIIILLIIIVCLYGCL